MNPYKIRIKRSNKPSKHGYAAMVLLGNPIYVSYKFYPVFLQILTELMSRPTKWSYSTEKSRALFFHEVYHLIQFDNEGYKIIFRFLCDFFTKSHDDRALEIDAMEFGQKCKNLSPKEAFELISNQ